MSFHQSGRLARISLSRTVVDTSVGGLPAELLLFHDNGTLRRLFPLDGTLDGYWDEAQEYAYAPILEVPTAVGNVRARLIAVAFYPDGKLFSVTLWPNEIVHVETPLGPLAVRTGISFYPSGALKSVEPNTPTVVDTPIGPMTAYDPDPIGLSGDRNSLVFDADGRIASLVTSVESFHCERDEGVVHYAPDTPWVNAAEEISSSFPVRITFLGKRVRIEKGPHRRGEYAIESVRVDRPTPTGRRHLTVVR